MARFPGPEKGHEWSEKRRSRPSARPSSFCCRFVKRSLFPNLFCCLQRTTGPDRRMRKRPRGIAACWASSSKRDPTVEDPSPSQLHRVGTIARILRYVTSPGRRPSCDSAGARGASASAEFVSGHPFLAARVEEIGSSEVITPEIEARRSPSARARQPEAVTVTECARRNSSRDRKHRSSLRLADFVAGVMDASTDEKQDVLEAIDVKDRLDKVLELLARRLAGAPPLEADFGDQTQQSLSSQQREHILREQTSPDSKGAGRRRRQNGRDRRPARRDRRKLKCRSRRKSRRKRMFWETPRANAGSGRRIRHDPRLPRLAHRSAPSGLAALSASTLPRRAGILDEDLLRGREGQAPHPRIPCRPQAGT